QCGLPCAVSVGDVDVRATLRPEHAAEIAQQARGELLQRGGIDVHGRPVHGAQDFIGHRGRAGDRQELPPCSNGHRLSPLRSRRAMLAWRAMAANGQSATAGGLQKQVCLCAAAGSKLWSRYAAEGSVNRAASTLSPPMFAIACETGSAQMGLF